MQSDKKEEREMWRLTTISQWTGVEKDGHWAAHHMFCENFALNF